MNPDAPDNDKTITRRKFFRRSAIVLGASAFGIYFGRDFLRRQVSELVADTDFPSGIVNFKPDFWFEVLEDNTILMKSAKVEMGQGIFTGLAMLAAEELEIPLDRIRVEPASTASGVVDYLGTGGSTTTMSLYRPVRETAATMREMLKRAAARHWGMEPHDVVASNGSVIAGARLISYAEIAALTTEWEIPDTPALKPESDFKYVGTEQKRIDLGPKVMGEALFGIDQALPDMLYATVLYSPKIEGVLSSVDTSQAEAQEGVVRVFRHENWIGVVAESRYAAEMGRRKLNTEWNAPHVWQQADVESIVTVGNGSFVTVQKDGGETDWPENDPSVIESEYRTPLGAHAQIEPNGCVAHVTDGNALILIGTQNVWPVQRVVAKALGLSMNSVEIRVTYLGGGFGRRYFRNNAVEAALLSQEVGRPVHVFNSREDEFLNGYYRPNTHHRLRARLGDDGRVESIEHQMASADMTLENYSPMLLPVLGSDVIAAGHGARWLYDAPNRLARIWHVQLPFQTGIWRGVGMVPNGFATECFMDELAHAAGRDPLQFRLDHLNGSDPIYRRLAIVLETLRDNGWTDPKEAGVGRGMACIEDRRSLAAAMVEVRDMDGSIRVTRVVQVVDPGMIINPDGVRMQVEGATMMGLSAAMYEELTVKDGRIAASNYHQYPMTLLKDTPARIDVIMLENAGKPYGVGEPPIAPMAPAIANAIYDLKGMRLRRLPLTKALASGDA